MGLTDSFGYVSTLGTAQGRAHRSQQPPIIRSTMGRKGRRNTAKTGDQSLKKKGLQLHEAKKKATNYDEDLDDFHQRREEDFLALDAKDRRDKEESDDEEGIMNLGDDMSSSSSEESISSDENEAPDLEGLEPAESSDDEQQEEELDDIRDWGKKANYYHSGVDDEGEEDDDELEEQAAKELQATKLSTMIEDDFVISDDEDDGAATTTSQSKSTASEPASRKDLLKKVRKSSPEMLPLLTHFGGVVDDLTNNSIVATSALLEGSKDTAEVSSLCAI